MLSKVDATSGKSFVKKETHPRKESRGLDAAATISA
jgi:hypothetical protein